METELNYTDQLINKIDDELLNLYNATQKKTEYQFFDFYEALIKFNEYSLKEGSRKEYINLKALQYRGVFNDLMFTESKVSWYEVIRYDPFSRIEKIEVMTRVTNEVGIKVSIKERKVETWWEHEYLKENIKNLKQKIPKLYSVNKYNYLLEDCQIITGANFNPSAWERNFKNGFNALFINYSLDLREQMTFDMYIIQLLFQKKVLQSTKPIINGSKSEVIPQLPTNLTADQRGKLFGLLIDGKFIPETTDKDCFNFAFGNHGQSSPDQWKSITWNEAKQGLRELLTPILGTITNQQIRDIELLFLKDGKPFEMNKNGTPSARCLDIEKIVNSLNLENIPTSTDLYRPRVNQ